MRYLNYLISFFLVVAIPLLLTVNSSFFQLYWSFDDLGKNTWLYAITKTGDGIFAVVTSAVLLSIILIYYRRNWRLSIALALYCSFAVVGTQFIKEGIKNLVEEPRPFVAEMAVTIKENGAATFFNNMQTTYNLNMSNGAQDINLEQPGVFTCSRQICATEADIEEHYYALTSDQREFFSHFFNDTFFAHDPVKHQAFAKLAYETGFSLPSGHAMMASVWLLIFVLLAIQANKISLTITSVGVIVWAYLLDTSRVILGYHYSHDILFSAVISWLFILFTFWLTFLFYRIILKIFPMKQDSLTNSYSARQTNAQNQAQDFEKFIKANRQTKNVKEDTSFTSDTAD